MGNFQTATAPDGVGGRKSPVPWPALPPVVRAGFVGDSLACFGPIGWDGADRSQAAQPALRRDDSWRGSRSAGEPAPSNVLGELRGGGKGRKILGICGLYVGLTVK